MTKEVEGIGFMDDDVFEEGGRADESRDEGREAMSRDALEDYYRQISRIPLLSRKDEFKIASKLRKTGDPALARKLVEANLRFVVKTAFKHTGYGFDVLDLIQEGNIGLMKATEKFNPERGYRFISYAVWQIRARIFEYILNNWSLVKIGTTQFQRRLFNSLRSGKQAARRRLESLETGVSEVSILARVARGTVEEVREACDRFGQKEVSLDVPVGGSDDGSLKMIEVIEDEEALPMDELLERGEVSTAREDVMAKAMSVLSDREREIITRRHLNDDPETLKELGRDFGISKERIRQLEVKALSKIKEAIEDGGADLEFLFGND